ncbi:MAG: hypothetical protein J6X18_07315 [Bacteroidales bacterium]|nr:hypothetical protein [Bacteroidales bacterium]
MQKINLNESVYVELNGHGWELIRKYYEDLLSVFSYTFYNDVEDSVNMHKRHTKPMIVKGEERMMTEFQLHEFMNIFGRYAYVGAKKFVVGNNLYFVDND